MTDVEAAWVRRLFGRDEGPEATGAPLENPVASTTSAQPDQQMRDFVRNLFRSTT